MAARSTSPFVEKEYDELDRKIDGFLGKIGAIFRFLIVVTGSSVALMLLRILWPNIDTWGPIRSGSP